MQTIEGLGSNSSGSWLIFAWNGPLVTRNSPPLRVLRLEEKEGRSSTHHKGHSGKCWLNLVHASKPHKLGVTSLAVDPEGKILATGVSGALLY